MTEEGLTIDGTILGHHGEGGVEARIRHQERSTLVALVSLLSIEDRLMQISLPTQGYDKKTTQNLDARHGNHLGT